MSSYTLSFAGASYTLQFEAPGTLPVQILALSQADLSDATPSALGTAAAGTGTTASRADHVHPTTGLALLAHTHAGTTQGSKLAQANTHETADTDSAPTALHHTLGTGANQAAPGNAVSTHAGLATGAHAAAAIIPAPDYDASAAFTGGTGTLDYANGLCQVIDLGSGTALDITAISNVPAGSYACLLVVAKSTGKIATLAGPSGSVLRGSLPSATGVALRILVSNNAAGTGLFMAHYPAESTA